MSIRKLSIAEEILSETDRQFDQWGEQNHPDGTGITEDDWRANRLKALNDYHAEAGSLTWRDILLEEVYEAFAETDSVRLREELIQVAAVALSWVDAVDRRKG